MSIEQPYSRLRQARRIDLVEMSPLPAPMAIYLEPTNICNFRCVYCPESFDDFKERTGGLHRLDRVVRGDSDGIRRSGSSRCCTST